jgi:membrane complex biogenesis BtpA family protein
MKKLPQLVGVIHLNPLPGAPGASHLSPDQALQQAGARAVKEAAVLAKNGFDGIILENFGDIPFFKSQVGPETIASLAVIAAAVREVAPKVSLGINVLRNDAKSALAIAAVTGADFIRVNILSGIAATDQGLIEGCAAELLRERIRLGAGHIAILGDVLVKHAVTLSTNTLELAMEENSLRAGSEGLIVTGDTTGRAPDVNLIDRALTISKHLGVPLYLGSGVSVELLKQLKPGARVIIGSAIRKGGKAGAPLDLPRIKKFKTAFKSYAGQKIKNG